MSQSDSKENNGSWKHNDIEIPDAPEICMLDFIDIEIDPKYTLTPVAGPDDSRRYQHDCDDCKYLGQFGKYDAYYCPNNEELIARYSDDGPDYLADVFYPSIGHPGWRHSSTINVVKAMAEEAGYL